MKRNPLTLIIGLLLILIFGLLLFMFQVRTTEVAVVTTFGKPTRDITAPGAYFKWPWPIQKVYKLDHRTQSFQDKLTEGLTGDSFNLVTSVYAAWRITEPKAFFNVFSASSDMVGAAERVIEQRLSNAKIGILGKHPLSDIISFQGGGTNLLAIEQEILQSVQSQIKANNWGLEIQTVGFTKIQLPEAVSAAVFERMKSERKVLADRSLYEGEAEAQKIRSEADRKAAELLANAEGKATEVRGRAEAEAAKSLAVFQQNPELANLIFRLNALESAVKDRSILIFDQHTPPFDLFRGVSTNLSK
jgi:membrane protease subunit HflC